MPGSQLIECEPGQVGRRSRSGPSHGRGHGLGSAAKMLHTLSEDLVEGLVPVPTFERNIDWGELIQSRQRGSRTNQFGRLANASGTGNCEGAPRARVHEARETLTTVLRPPDVRVVSRRDGTIWRESLPRDRHRPIIAGRWRPCRRFAGDNRALLRLRTLAEDRAQLGGPHRSGPYTRREGLSTKGLGESARVMDDG